MSTKSQKSEIGSTANGQCRNWTFIIYPGDSCPDNYAEILDDLHVEWVESPLHDKDLNGDGSPKKPHKHIAVLFDGKKSYDQVLDISNLVGGTIPQRIMSVKGTVRYFAHLDNPEKAQYRIGDVIAHGGVDLTSLLQPSATERYEILRDMMTFCLENDIFEFSDLVNYAMQERYSDWFPVLTDHNTLVMQTYLTSRRHKIKGTN